MQPLMPMRPMASTRSARHTVWALLLLLLLTLSGACAWLLVNMRTGAQEDAELRLMRFVLSAEAIASRSLDSFDMMAGSVDELLRLEQEAQLRARPAAVQAQDMRSTLQMLVRQNPLVQAATVLDRHAQVVATSAQGPAVLWLAEPGEGWAQILAQTPQALAQSPPFLGPDSLDRERMLYVLRPLSSAEPGYFLLIQVPVAGLGQALMQGGVLDGLEVTLERGNGQLLLALPAQAYQSEQPLPALGSARPAVGVTHTAARLSLEPALSVAHALPQADLWITASLPMAVVLGNWRMAAWGVGAALLVFAALLAALEWTVRAYMRRLHATQVQAQRSEQRLDQALDSMVSGFLLLDERQRVLQWNRCYADWFPWQEALLRPGVPLIELLQAAPGAYDMPMSESQLEQVQALHLRLMQQPGKPVEQQLPSGRFVQMTARPAAEGGMVITYSDVTDIRLATAEIESLAFYDPLTSLPNRRLLLDRLAQATVLAAREGWTGALLFLDLDQFKMLNDTLGHEVGDQLLQQVAQRLRVAVRSSDTVARLGGDEFVVMLCELAQDASEAATLAQRIGDKILARLNQAYVLGGHTHRSACSIGATLFGSQPQSAAELLKQADIAMYQIKARSGSGLCFFDPQMQVEIHQRVRMEGDLRQALAQSQFELHYQPQFTLAGEVIGAEALLRWRHPERGLVPPGMFIAVAEESDIIVQLGMWVIRTACVQLAVWQRDQRLRHLQLAVNVSARQFQHPDFAAQVISEIQAAGITPQLLKLELTESLVIDNVQSSIAKMKQLRAHGVCFSMDDFGTGHSSLTYLTQLPLDQLKIDQSFVRHLGVRHTDDVIVQTIIGMARNLNLEVIAEGVETVDQRALLAYYGCEYFQGYLFSPPVPIDTFEKMLSKVPVRTQEARAASVSIPRPGGG